MCRRINVAEWMPIIVGIHSATAEIWRGKKEEEETRQKYNVRMHAGGHKNT